MSVISEFIGIMVMSTAFVSFFLLCRILTDLTDVMALVVMSGILLSSMFVVAALYGIFYVLVLYGVSFPIAIMIAAIPAIVGVLALVISVYGRVQELRAQNRYIPVLPHQRPIAPRLLRARRVPDLFLDEDPNSHIIFKG